MKKTRILTLLAICALAALIFLLNNMGLAGYFYWKYWWYDIMMHGLTGFVIGSIVTWGFLRIGYAQKLSRPAFFWATVLGIVIVGVGWEIMEYTNGFFIGEVNVLADTILDIIMDITGGIVGWFLLSRTLSEKSDNSQLI